MKGKQTESRSSSGLHECIQMTMAGLTSFETKPCLQGPSLIPVSNRKLPWVQMRHGTGSNTRNQNEISVPDFGSQTFTFPSVSPIKSQNRSELRKAFSSQNTIKKAPQPLWRGQGEVLDGARTGCTVPKPPLGCRGARWSLGSEFPPSCLWQGGSHV